jgi:predicted cobalt transporter CbtA
LSRHERLALLGSNRRAQPHSVGGHHGDAAARSPQRLLLGYLLGATLTSVTLGAVIGALLVLKGLIELL